MAGCDKGCLTAMLLGYICCYHLLCSLFAAALLPRLFGTNPRSHQKGATGRVRAGDQRLPVLFHFQTFVRTSNVSSFVK